MTNRNTVLYKCKYSGLTDVTNYQELAKIGLTKMSVQCYEVLMNQTFLATKEIADRLNKPYRSVQRCLNELRAKGFVRKVYTGYGPRKYEARLLYEAMDLYCAWQKQQIEQLIDAQKIKQYERELAKFKR